MDRRTILAVVLSLAIYYAWLLVKGPAEKPPEVAPTEEAPVAAASAPAPPEPQTAPEADLPPVLDVAFAACGVEGLVSTDGGRIHALRYPELLGPYDVTPLYRWVWGKVTGASQGPWQPWGEPPAAAVVLSERAQGFVLGTGSPDARVRMRVVSTAPGALELLGRTSEGVEVREQVAEDRTEDGCRLAVTTTYTNAGEAAWEGVAWLGVSDHTAATTSSYQSQHQPTALVDGRIAYGGKLGAGCVRAGTQLSDERLRVELPGDVSWFGVADRYFGFLVVPAGAAERSLAFTRTGEGEQTLDGGLLSFPLTLAPGASRTEHWTIHAGPNDTARLTAVDPTLTRAVDLGYFAFFAWPLLAALRWLHGHLGNWGLAIIALTLGVKLAFFPMTQRAMKSMARMQAIQPEINRLREQLADQPSELNRRTMELFQQHGVSPLGGCLPMVLQIPVFIALYNTLLTSVELYQQEFLYLRDLTSPDPYLVLPVSITFLMWLQQQLSTPAAGMDPVQQQILKWMPIGFGLFFFLSPSGLGVYFFVNIALSILQQWIIKRSLGSGSLPAPAAAGT